MTISVIGVDLSKNVFHLVGSNHVGRVLLRQKVNRKELIKNLTKYGTECKIRMEACQSAHHWSRELEARGYFDVKQISPQFVKPFVKSNKNDFNDAEAIMEAGTRHNMRFVASKSVFQQEIQSLHRVRERLVKNRTGAINQCRSILAEHGLVFPKGRKALRVFLCELDSLSPLGMRLIELLRTEIQSLDEQISCCNKQLTAIAQQCEVVKRLCDIPGFGILGATALLCCHGDLKSFTNARQFSAWIGLVPKQHSTGGKPRLLGISKRGNRYLRMLLIHGARNIVRYAVDKDDSLSLWIRKLRASKHINVVAVSVANKNARVAWKLLTSDAVYDPSMGRKADTIQ